MSVFKLVVAMHGQEQNLMCHCELNLSSCHNTRNQKRAVLSRAVRRLSQVTGATVTNGHEVVGLKHYEVICIFSQSWRPEVQSKCQHGCAPSEGSEEEPSLPSLQLPETSVLCSLACGSATLIHTSVFVEPPSLCVSPAPRLVRMSVIAFRDDPKSSVILLEDFQMIASVKTLVPNRAII